MIYIYYIYREREIEREREREKIVCFASRPSLILYDHVTFAALPRLSYTLFKSPV